MFFIEIAFLMPMFTSLESKPPSTSSKSLSSRAFDQVSNIKMYLKQVHLHLFYFDISALFMQLLYFDFSPQVSRENTPDSDHRSRCPDYRVSLPHSLASSLLHSASTQPRLWALLLKGSIMTCKAVASRARLPASLTSPMTLGSSFYSAPPFPSYAVRMVITTSNFIGAL